MSRSHQAPGFIAPAAPSHRSRRQAAIAANRSDTLPTLATLTDNVTRWFKLAQADPTITPDWYRDAHDLARSLADVHGVTPATAVAILAVLSPGTDWDRNVDLAEHMMSTGDCNHRSGDAIVKARRILQGENPDYVIGGRKVKSFRHNVGNPDHPGHVTVDRHAATIALLPPPTTATAAVRTLRRTLTLPDAQLKVLERPGVYVTIAGAYRTVARRYGLLPSQVQSMTWEYFRANHSAMANTPAPEETF